MQKKLTFALWQKHGYAPNHRGDYDTLSEALRAMGEEIANDAKSILYTADSLAMGNLPTPHNKEEEEMPPALIAIERCMNRSQIDYWIMPSDFELYRKALRDGSLIPDQDME